ncbi:glycosyl hydrolase family 18 protein [Colwellia sp. 12G3]|uniref:glycosyl hydrolase family 18 protein n=1 Tax=Colwellia sp. 12G3 TaxID=2058299 RepID=UPI000C337A16|nr:glycosyl hydrolase family 18 protein [Colwellia sp. 12G3]PKI16421.1 chitinase [Colwellia sp. 12G3]
MNKRLLTVCAISAALSSQNVDAAPSAPSIDWTPQSYSFVEVNLEGLGSYKDLVKAKELVDISIKWNAWSGSGGDNYKVYFDNTMVNEGNFAAGTKSGVINFPYAQSGRHQLTIALCEGTVCATSAQKDIIIADTDGGHLAPLTMNIDPNNKSYPTQIDNVVGAYFVEWGIYGRGYDVSQIPADNLTHLLYGFIPICGANASLKEIENGNSWRALETACAGSADYEVVIHDPWAAVQKTLPGIDATDPIRGTYAQLMALKQRNPDLKILPSVGGWTLSDPFYGFTQKANRDVFVASMKKFLKTWKFYDGVDIDWEFPGGDGASTNLGDPINDGPAYVALMQELRTMLNELEAETGRTYELTSAIGSGYDKIEDVDYAAAAQFMDYIFAMTYDFFGGWNNVTGHQTGLNCGSHISVDECNGTGLDDKGEPRKGPAYTITNAVDLLLAQGVAAKKIVVGTAMYGRGWEGVMPDNTTILDNPMTADGTGKLTGSTAQGVWEAGIIDYKGLAQHMVGAAGTGVNGFEVGYDEMADAAYVWNKQSGKLVTYDSPRSVIAKGQYVNASGLGGLFAWEIDADNGDILNAMHEGLGGVVGPINKKPVINLANSFSVNSGEIITIAAIATDADNDSLTYSWTMDSALTATATNTANVVITANTVTKTSNYAVTLSVSDGKSTVSKSTTLTVVAPSTGNTAPVVAAINDVTIEEAMQASIAVSATDADNDSLTYTWQVPTGLTLVGSGANVSLTAGDVTADTSYTVTVEVSDGTAVSAQSFTVTVTHKTTGGNGTWDSSKIYNTGDTVVYNEVTYQANWWTKGEQPDQSAAWSEVIPDDGQVRAWRADLVYNGGDKVSHNGETYTAGWWTKGEEPGVADVWKK